MIKLFDRIARWLRFNWMYLGSPPWDTGITPPELVQFIREYPQGRAIDLGCGTGTNLVSLGQAGWQVTGVDFVARAVEQARRRLERAAIHGEVRLGDVSRLETVRGEYELVLDIGCYHALPPASRVSYRANLAQILVPGGHFLFYAHWGAKDSLPGIGIFEEDLFEFQKLLSLEERQDSSDRFGRRACWMRFRKQD